MLILVAISFSLRRGSFRNRFSKVSFLIISIIIAAIFLLLSRLTVQSPRPFEALDFAPLINSDPTPSFPSGHTIVFAALASAMWVVNKRKGYWFLLGAFLIGVGRVISGVHWPTDIVGGLILGALSAYIAYKIFPNKEYLITKTDHSN